MKEHKVVSITGATSFNPADYPSLEQDLNMIAEHTEGMLPLHKEDIIISYLKNHSIKTIWLAANPLLTALVTSNVLPTATIEALFECSRSHTVFRNDLELFIRKMLAAKG